MAKAKYALRIFWNGEQVLYGFSSGVMAYESILIVTRDAFCGRSWESRQTPSLDSIIALKIGEEIAEKWEDETGKAECFVMRVA